MAGVLHGFEGDFCMGCIFESSSLRPCMTLMLAVMEQYDMYVNGTCPKTKPLILLALQGSGTMIGNKRRWLVPAIRFRVRNEVSWDRKWRERLTKKEHML